MKKINLVSWVNPTNGPTVCRRSTDGQSLRHYSVGLTKLLFTLSLLLTLGVGQMWGAAKQRYIYVGISDKFDEIKEDGHWGFNFWGGTSAGVKSGTWIENITHDDRTYHMFRVQVCDDNNKSQFKVNESWWEPSEGIDVTLNGTNNNAIMFTHGDDGGWWRWQQDYQVSSTGSLSASSTSVAIGTNVTLTPSLSSNSDYNDIKSTTYNITTNPNSGGSMSGNVFSATKAGTYVVTATITYNAKDFTGITKTVDVTKTITVYATVTFDREGGSGGTGSQNATYNSATSNISAPSKDYHDFAGYWTGDDGTGTMVINASGVWQKNISNFTDNSSTAKWIILTNQTLHAKWTPKNYSITYKDEGDVAYSGSNSASLPSSYTYGTGVALTDGVKSGYRFDGWFTTSACTGDPVTSVSSSDNGAKVFYAKWTENPGGTITLTAGTGGQVSKDGSSWGASKSYTGIKTTDALNIYAQANDGYVFSSWTRTSGTGTIASTSSASTTYTPVANADAELTANFAAKTNSLSVSSSTLYAGDNITLTATRTNHSLNLTYQYKIGDGLWTDIATQSGTSKTWQIPYANTYQTYKFRVKSTDGSVDIISSEQTVTVYGRITIHVKNTNSWATMKLYSWYNDGSSDHTTNGTWNGTTGNGSNGQSCSVHATGSLWWDVTITEITTHAQKFILSCSTSGNQNKTADLNLSSFTHDAYYAMSTNGSSAQTLSTTTTPSAPTLSTSAASSIAATSATLGGNVTNLGNDIISERGYYWSTNSTLSSSNLGVGTKVTVSGTQSSTGTFSNSKTGLTNGTTYYFIAYAKNGYGTSYGAVNNFRTKFITTVTLNKQGGSDGTSEVTATEGSAMPSGKTAPGKTGYTFGGYYASAGGSGTQYYNSSMGSANNWDVAASTATIHAKWTPITYTIHFNGNGNTSGSMSDQTGVTYDAATTITANAFAKTGYNFGGWATTQERANAGTVDRADGAAHGNLASTQGATAQLWAVWTAKTTTISYSQSGTGYGSGGQSTTQTATYDAAMPTPITTPTAANGYAFMGYFDDEDGEGTQYYNADGTSAHTWDKEDASFTLHAYFKKAEITDIAFTDGAVMAPSTSKTVTATIEPTPTGTTTVCWRVLYSNDNPLYPQPTFDPVTAQGNSVSFIAPATSGSYKVEATLHLGSGCGGTELSIYKANFQVAGEHTVTVQYKCGDDVIAASTSVTGRPLAWSDDITAPTIFGYTFARWNAGDGITIKNGDSDPVTTSTDEIIKIKAVYDGKLTAVYNKKQYIYLDLSQQFGAAEWTAPHVYFYKAAGYWDDTNGAGATGENCVGKGAMTQIGDTKIWYYDYSSVSNFGGVIAFTKEDKMSQENFWSTEAIYRGDFTEGTPVFVPLVGQVKTTKNTNCDYYNAGYWVTYLGEKTGYTLRIKNNSTGALIKEIPFTSENKRMTMKAITDLEASTTYKFEIMRDNGKYYKNNSSMTYSSRNGNWKFTEAMSIGTIATTASGDYTFNLSYADNNNDHDYELRVNVEYPVASGDYRLIYKDDVQTKYLTSANVTKTLEGKDTVSFFVRPNGHPILYKQTATVNALNGAVTWATTETNLITAAMLTSPITKDSVYNFNLVMDGEGALSVESVDGYSGHFYIRTDAANNKWDNFKNTDHLMTYSEYSEKNANYSHYFMAYVGNGTNVKCVVANDYSVNISDTLTQQSGDVSHVNASGFILADANIRFMWDKNDNSVGRAYLAAAKNDGSKFLVLRANSSSDLMDENGNPLLQAANSDEDGYNHKVPDNSMQFIDDENWIYETTVKVRPSSFVKLYATFHGADFYYKGLDNNTFDGTVVDGTPNAIQLMTGTGDAEKIRVIYDFKTDRLVSAWLPSGNINEEREINADVMFVREHQEDITQLTFSKGAGDKMGAITEIKTAYAVLRFNKWTLNNKSKAVGHAVLDPLLSRYERDMFYVSFPFRVSMNEVFGFGKYGQHWIIEEYDGESRAKNGFWADTPTYWRFITDRRGKFFEPNQGYIIALDLDELGESSEVWNNGVENVELYFPSYGEMGNITNATVEYTLPEYICTINRPTPKGDRRIEDSHWHVMSVPTYVNTSSVAFANTDWKADRPKFLYEWNMNDNSLTARSGDGYTYHAMHAYIVQYAGKVTWTSTSVTPASIVARRTYEEAPNEVEFRIELSQNEQMIDQAFVRMSNDEEVSAGFAFGEDLSKEFNKNKANIYTMVTSDIDGDLSITETAGNCLPMSEQTTIVPMGVQIAKAGEYTISIPSGTNGVGVTLIDNETGLRTNLALEDYRVELDAATYNNRFIIEISPIVSVLTGVEQTAVSDQPSDVRKVIIDQKMYIIKDGKVYDAQGARVR